MRETVTRIMVELLTNDLAIQYNLNGQKGKMSFGKHRVHTTFLTPNSRPFQGLNIFFKAKQNWKKVDLLRNARRSKHTFINMLSASQLFHSAFTQLR